MTVEMKQSWTPMIAIALAQVLMSFNVASLPVSIGGMVQSFGVPPTTVATAIVMYSLSVAGFVMLGAKLNQRFGSTVVFRATALMFGVAMALMTFAPAAIVMISAQGLAGLAGAAMVPSLVALIANHYKGAQQATALGALGSARAFAGVTAFLVGGVLGTMIGWRPSFAILMVVAAAVFLLSFKLKSDAGDDKVSIDLVGVALAASAIIMLSFGFNNLNRWGLGLARPGAPFDVLGLSPAPIMIVVGGFLGQSFMAWTRRRQESGRTPLLALEVLGSAQERAAVAAMFTIVALEAMLNFTVPLYIQIVQGRTPLDTAFAMMPFNLTVFVAALMVIRLYDHIPPRNIARGAFALSSVALLWLAFVVTNDWSTIPVIVGLVAFGAGQGALVTLVFSVLVTAVPKALAGDVGSLRGTANNLAAAIGTAVAGALVVGLLSSGVLRGLATNPILTPELQAQVNLDNINFVTDVRLRSTLEATTATPEQIEEALRVNSESRLRALKIALLLMSGLALLALFPAGRLPGYVPGDAPATPGSGK